MTDSDSAHSTSASRHGASVLPTSIAEADGDAGALRYRGVDIRDLIDSASYEQVWSLLVCDTVEHPLPPNDGAAPAPSARPGDDHLARLPPWQSAQRALHTRAVRLDSSHLADPADVVSDLADLTTTILATTHHIVRDPSGHNRNETSSRPRDNHAALRASDSWAHLIARAAGTKDVDERARALNAYWIAAAEHGLNASTFTARVVASAGASPKAAMIAGLSAISGPLHGGAPREVHQMLAEAAALGDPEQAISDRLASGRRLMGFGHRVYRDDDPRAAVLRQLATDLDIPGLETVLQFEHYALRELAQHSAGRRLATNLEFWAAVLLDYVGIGPDAYSLVFACARAAGWSAHILEQITSGRPVRPVGQYVGAPERSLREVAGAGDVFEG